MGKQLLVFVFAVCAAIAGWSQSPAHISSDSADMATIYLYITKDSFDLNYRLKVNSDFRFNLRSAEVRKIKVPAGLVEVSARHWMMGTGPYSFFVEPGSTHYLRISARTSTLDYLMLEILEVPEQMFLQDQRTEHGQPHNVTSEQGTATVYLYRPKYTRLRSFNVEVNDQAPLKLKRQQVDTLHLPPGQHVFKASGFSCVDGSHTLHLRAGEVVYLRLHESADMDNMRSRLEFVEVTASTFRRDPR